MKQHVLFKLVVLPFLLSLLLVACNRENPAEYQSPASHIYQAEQLEIPESIDLPANDATGYTRVATYYAVGVQVYKSRLVAGSVPAQYEWKFVAPQATLYDARNRAVGTHAAGPTWQLYGTTDSIYGQAFSPPRFATSPDPAAIDWLLLGLKTGQPPTGIFADVTYIQRIATTMGKAPVTPPATENETVNVPYTAIYRFSKLN